MLASDAHRSVSFCTKKTKTHFLLAVLERKKKKSTASIFPTPLQNQNHLKTQLKTHVLLINVQRKMKHNYISDGQENRVASPFLASIGYWG